VEPDGEFLAENTDPAAEHDRGETQQDLPEIHVEPDHRVMETELERITEQESRQQDKRRGVGPQDRHIRQEQEPAHQETVVLAEHFRDKTIGPARTLDARAHLMEIKSQYDDRHRADQEADHRARGAGIRQEHRAGKDKGAPADSIAAIHTFVKMPNEKKCEKRIKTGVFLLCFAIALDELEDIARQNTVGRPDGRNLSRCS